MDYKAALKRVQAPKKPKQNYLSVKVNYDLSLILPYAEGIVLMEALGNAERMNSSYGTKPAIIALDRDAITATPMSLTEYEQIKVSTLLGVSLDDVKENWAAIESA